MQVDDIIVTNPFDPRTGDFDVQDSNVQNQQTLLFNAPGQFYASPTLGVDIRDNLNAPIRLQLLRARVIAEFGKDGYELTQYDFTAGADGFTVDIDAVKIR
jgi:hypothetical protein